MENNDKKDKLLFFKPGLWQRGYLDAAKNGTIFSKEWYHFQQELMVSKTIVKHSIIFLLWDYNQQYAFNFV